MTTASVKAAELPVQSAAHMESISSPSPRLCFFLLAISPLLRSRTSGLAPGFEVLHANRKQTTAGRGNSRGSPGVRSRGAGLWLLVVHVRGADAAPGLDRRGRDHARRGVVRRQRAA